MNKRIALRAVLAFLVWVAVLGVGGHVAGGVWVPSLGADLMAIIGAWFGAIAGLVHVLILSIKTRRAKYGGYR